ncbi:hypothetical protein [Lapillicoccus sp.]|uniref:hypothetical protein n=1 Tax=Lapillicoccus sp. TaxID=1909287 RepID=UPI003266C9A7
MVRVDIERGADRPGLRVAGEYKTEPLWIVDPDGAQQNPSPEEIGLPADLAVPAVGDRFHVTYRERMQLADVPLSRPAPNAAGRGGPGIPLAHVSDDRQPRSRTTRR